jgi:uncharacterized protein YndB with AHSA1/START domain
VSRELRFERLIQALPARVFDLFTSPEGQCEFYGKDAPGWVVDSSCELRIGGPRSPGTPSTISRCSNGWGAQGPAGGT